MNGTLAKKIVDYVGCTAAALEKAQSDATTKEAQAKQVEARVPGLVKQLRQCDYIDASLEKDAADVLHDPVRTLELLKRVIEKSAQVRIGAPAGSPAPTSLQNPNVGARSSQPRESDRVFLERLGLSGS